MRRHFAGLVALGAFLSAGVLWYWPIGGFPDMPGGCVRVGMVFTCVWLAYDQVQRLPGWLLAVVPLFLAILAFRARWALVLLPLLLLLAVLRPRRR